MALITVPLCSFGPAACAAAASFTWDNTTNLITSIQANSPGRRGIQVTYLHPAGSQFNQVINVASGNVANVVLAIPSSASLKMVRIQDVDNGTSKFGPCALAISFTWPR